MPICSRRRCLVAGLLSVQGAGLIWVTRKDVSTAGEVSKVGTVEGPPAGQADAAAAAVNASQVRKRWRYGDGTGKCDKKWHHNACPGTFEVPNRTARAPWGDSYKEEWRLSLGDRIVNATQGEVTSEQCDGFFYWGDFCWCNKAVEPENWRGTEGVIGISVGIQNRDLWSELMSNRYELETRLYDCYYGTRPGMNDGPMAYNKTGGESSVSAITGGGQKCPNWRVVRQTGCYQTPYTVVRQCLDNVTGKPGHTSLSKVLEGRPPLSTFVKLDIEGCEWSQLDALLRSPADMERIRTLDMEVHYGLGEGGVHSHCFREESARKLLEFRVGLMEKLLDTFAVSGSTLSGLIFNEARATVIGNNIPNGSNETRKVDPNIRRCIVNREGWTLDQYAISYVNRKLLESVWHSG